MRPGETPCRWLQGPKRTCQWVRVGGNGEQAAKTAGCKHCADGAVLCVGQGEDSGKQLSSGVIKSSTRPFGHPSGDVRGTGCINAEFRGAYGAGDGDLAAVACEALGHMSPGMMCSGERRALPEDQLTKARQPQSKDSEPWD